MSDFRERLATVLYEDGQRPMHTAVRLADAVIKKLDSEWSIGNDDDGRVLWDNYDDALNYQYRKEPLQHRYVTEWIDLDES